MFTKQKSRDSLGGLGQTIKSLINSDKSDSDFDEVSLVNLITVESETEKMGELKKSFMTVLFAKHWQKAKKPKPKKEIKYQPTYRLEPILNVTDVTEAIEAKTKKTLENILDKNGTYNTEFTPRFLKIVCEMLKNDCKSFKLDRYKLICTATILQRVDGQSMQFVSKMASNPKTDKLVCFSSKSKSFYIICVIYFIYKD